MSTQTLSYAIDEHDHLIRVDEGYYSFAEENGWEEATPASGARSGTTLPATRW